MKRFLSLFLFALLFGRYAFSYDFSAVCSSGQTLYYTITSRTEPYTVEITYPKHIAGGSYYSGYDQPTGNLVIPESVLHNDSIYSVTSIGNYAFFDCKELTSLIISNSVTNINISSSSAFEGCSGFVAITVAEGNSVYDSRNNCNAIIKTNTNELILGCQNTVIPNSVTSIGSRAFSGCSELTAIIIPNSIIRIGSYVFQKCNNLQTIIVDSGNSVYDSRDNCNAIIETASNTLIVGCKNTIIPNTVTKIGDSAFEYCSGLTNIMIPNSVISIEAWAFAHCYELTEITIPNSVTSIAINAFYETGWYNNQPSDDMMYLDGWLIDFKYGNRPTGAYIIEDGTRGIAASAFSGCYGLTSITIPNTVKNICSSAFSNCSGLTSISIPNSVTIIDAHSFYGCSGLTSVTIPNSVTSIGDGAFYNCSGLTSVTIPNSVTSIGSSAFYGCSGLTSVSIPNSVTSIGGSAFENCSGLTSVTIPNSVTSIGDYAFQNCSELTSVTIPSSVTSIRNGTFKGCNSMTSITIPSSVTNIGNGAFSNCSGLTNIYANPTTPPTAFGSFSNYTATIWVPCGLTETYRTAYGWSNFSDIREHFHYTIDVASANSQQGNVNITQQPDCTNDGSAIITATPADGYVFTQWNDGNTDNPRTIIVTDDTTFTASFDEQQYYIAYNATAAATGEWVENNTYTDRNTWDSNTGNGVLYLKPGVTTIGGVNSTNYSPFNSNTNLVSVNLDNSGLTSIGGYAFYGCNGLSGTLTIPNSVTSIGSHAFYNCSGLTSVKIHNHINAISNAAFGGSNRLEAVFFAGNVEEWCRITFDNYDANPIYYAHNLYIDNNLVTDLVIPETITEIKDYAFRGATCLTSVTIPNCITSIGNSAFRECTGLTSITIPNSVTYIDEYAFFGNSALTEVDFPNSVASVGSCIFNGSNVPEPIYNSNCFVYFPNGYSTEYVIQNGIKQIAGAAFSGCSELTEVSIPNSVTNIGSSAFKNCSGLTEITIPNSVTYIGGWSFNNCRGLREISISNSVTNIDGYTFQNCSSLTSITIPNSITNIGDWAFDGCIGLSSLIIPDSVLSIGGGAFYGCNGLTEITIGRSVSNIKRTAFYNCSNLTTIYIKSSTPASVGNRQSFPDYSATLYVPCGTIESYSTADGWSNFSDIREHFPYTIDVASANSQQGTASITQQPNCNDGNAIITATSTDGYVFAQWNDGNTDNPRTLTVTQDTVFTAQFELARCLIASGTCGADGDNLTWTLSCDSLLTISGSGAMEDYSSTGAPWYGDYRSKIKTLVIDDGVTSIGDYAFEGCSGLTSVTIGNSISDIGMDAFYDCNGLTAVYYTGDIAQWCGISFVSYYSNPLAYAHKLYINNELLTSLVIPEIITEIKDYAFNNASCLTSVTIPYSVTSIGSTAFYGCSGLTSVSIPNSVTSIGGSAFKNCSGLTSVTIGSGVTNIGADAFYGCSGLSSVYYKGDVAGWFEITFDSGTANPLYFSVTANPLYFAHNLYVNNELVTDLVIPQNVTTIKNCAFYNATCLTSITIPNSVTSIGEWAFRNCSELTSVNFNATNCTTMGSSDRSVFSGCASLSTLNIGENVTNIPNNAFQNCNGLTSVTIPNSVTSIGNSAFFGCSGLTTVNFNATNCTSMGLSVWSGCSSLSTLNIGENVTNIPKYAFQNCNGLTSVTIPNSVTSIGSDAFNGCTGLTTVTIGNSVTSIGGGAFYSCSGLTTVNFNATNCTSMYSVWSGCSSLSTLNIGENVINIPDYAFYGCSLLTSLIIPNSVTNIGIYAFSFCVGLTSVTIPNSVTSIGDHAFRYCSGLTTVNFNATNCTTMGISSVWSGCSSLSTLNIGENVTNIPAYAFSGCNGLTGALTIPNSVTSIGDRAFYNCSGLTTVNFNATNCTTMGSSVWSGCSSLSTLNIGENVTNIPANAFSGCSGLSGTLTVPNSVASIGNSAFYNCSGLTSVTIPNSVTSIGNYAFQNCSGLTTITIPDSVASIGSYAFSGCSGLEDVRYNARNAQGGTSSSFPSNLHLIYLGDSVESIGNYMFYECTFLDSIVSAAVNPPAMNARTFYFVNIPNVPVIVPCRCVAAYEGADYWNNFNTVRQAFGCIQEYTITVVSANPDFGSVSGSGTYEQGTEVAISATPATHYHFVQWNDGNTDNPRTITVTADATYIAEFAIDQHTITLLSANGSMGSVNESGTYDYGTEVEISATASEHHRFISWNDGNTENPRTVTVTGDAMYIATFAIDQFTITVLTSNYAMGTVTGGGTYNYGTERQISAIPTEQYQFIQWNDGNTDNPRSITVTENATYTAQFDVQHTIRYNATAEATGAWVENNTNTNRNTWDSNTGDGVLYLNSGVTTIGGSSSTNSSPFNNNTNLVSVDLDNSGLRSIDRFAFNNCSSLTSITIGKNITSVDAYSFDNCNGLSAVYYTGGVADWCEISFSNPANPLNYAHNLYINNNLVTDLVIPNTVTEIKQYAFQGATCLTTITIPSSVTSIGSSAFHGCNGLTAVYYTGDIAQWCGISFSYWSSTPLAYAHKLYINNELVTNLVIPETITEIKDYAFYSCNSLTSVTIPNSVTSIGRSAFYNCTSLSPITIGNSVASIGQSAFAGCYIYDIYANPITPPVFTNPDDSFSSYGYSATVYVPCGSEEAYRSADGWSNFTNIQERGTYTLDVTSANPQQGSANVTQQPNCSDGTALITATPIENFRFVHWNDGNTDNPRTIMVTQDTAFVAVFEEHPQYTITVHSANTSQGSVAGNGTYAEGTEVSISATAYEHNHFVSWNDGNTDNPRTITVTEDAMYIATFAIDQFTIAVSANDYVMGTASGTGTYNYGTERQISAAPSAHYHFVSWNDGNTDNPRTIIVTQNAAYTARFAIDQHTITVASSNTSMGTASGGGTYDYGASRQISASPSAHYHFVQWNDGNTTNPRTINVTADATYTAEFAIDEFTVTVSANNNYMGTVAGGGTYDYGTELQISAVPATCNRFVQWNDGNTESPRTITVVGNTSYTAVFETYQLTVSLSAEQIACNGGTANIINAVEGGTVPYAYSWSNGATSQNLTGVVAGTYSVTITDSNGCEATASTTITEPEPLTVSVLSNDPLCLGNSTKVTSSVAGGTTPYSYAWSNGETAAVVSVAAEGAYSLTVTDANNCTSASSVNITGYEIVASIAMSSDEFSDGIYYYNACAGGSIEMNGIIQSGTVDSWRWYINPHNGNSSVFTTQNVTYTPTDALAHDITLTAMDEHGCPVVAQGRIRVSGGLAVPTLISPAEGGICQGSERIITIGETEGSGIQVSGSYIEALPDYKVNNDTTFLPDGIGECYNTSLVFDMFTDGETVTSVDDIDRIYINMEHSYLGDLSMMIQCPNGQQCLLHANKIGTETMPSLNWTNNGGINNSGSLGGDSPTYPHLGLSPDPSSSSNCYYTAGEGYSYYFTPTSTTPFGSSGPTTPITYTDSCGNTERNNVLNEGDYATYESMSSLIGCPLNGEWTLYVCDHLGADNGWIFEWGLFFREDLYPATWGYDVYAVSTLVESNSLGVSDYSDASGAGIMIAPPANFSGNNQHVNIQVVDNFGCISSSHMEVDFDVTAPFDATITGKTNVCDGAGTTLTAVADGGVAPFAYNWNTAETTASISPVNITGSVNYNVSVIDASGCTGTAETSVLISNPTVSMSSVAVNCHNGNDGTATATITNGNSVAPYTYTWSDGTTATIDQTSHSITVPAGTYDVTVSDAGGCSATGSVVVSQPVEALTASLSAEEINCNGETTEIITAVEGGTAPYNYAWSNGETSQNLTGDGAGTYSITVTDNNGCEATANANITEPEPLTVSLSAETIQYNGGTTDIINTVAGGTMPYTYAWSNGETSQNLESVVAGTYSVTVTDNNGCIATESVFLTEPELFTIVVSSSDDAMGTVNGSGTYDEGTEIAISATSAVHCHFVQWNDGNTSNPRTVTVTEDTTYIAEFALDQHTVTVLSANATMGTVSESGTYDYGTEIEISATPSEHHHFVSWSDGNTENPRIVTVTEDVMYIATFAIDQFAITVTANDYTMGTVSGGGIYNYGSERQIYASPYAHYRFVQWSDGNTDNPRTINVTADATYTAEFEIGQITITVSSSNEEMGTVSRSGSYDYGAEIQISAIAAEHHHFVQWNDGNTENPRAITVTEDATFIAEFAIDQFTISVVSENETMGTVSGGGTYDYSSTILISATPVEHYHFVQWNDGNTENPRTVIVTENVTYTASFAIGQITITATSADETMGTVYGGGSYGYGAEIQITATATEHYHFVQWSDGSTENPRMVIVTEDATYIATFAIDWYTINVTANNATMGTVSGGGTYEYNTEIQISASAIEHHHFVQWNDGNTDNPRTISVTDDATYTAEFAIDQFVVAVVSANDMMGFVSGNGSYDYGSEIQITAEANEHYHFVSWNDGNTDNPRNITVTENVTYTAEFAIDQFTIAVVSENNAMGTVSEGGTYDYGTEIQISVMPYEHYHFVQWNDGNTDNPRTIVATENATYTATFAIDQYEITVSSADEEMGTVYGSGIYNYGSVAIIMALANDGYEFVSWNDENTDNPRQIMVTEEATFIATFDQEIVPVIYYTFSETACGRYIWNGQTYSESGEYYQTFTTANSTDSIVRLDLVILPVPEPEITVDGILDACNPETASVTLSTGEYTSYIWSNGETTSSIVVTTPDVYYVEVVDSIGCHGVSEMATVGYSSVITEAPWIKRVGMSNSGTNIISWGVTSNTGITGFEVYRENTEADVYTCIARIDRPGARLYNDITSEPSARAYRYKICAVDECGGRSPMSDFHKTMHLTINRGLGTTWNLIWSHYEGLEFSTYRIYAGTEPNSMSMVVGEIPSNLNSFTDINNTLEEGMYYRVEVVMNRVTKDDEISLSSNIVANEFVERYSVVALSNNANFGTVYGGGTYPALLNTTLYAEPNDGYEFVSWSDGNTDNPRVINVTGDAIYVATFAESAPAPVETYTITAVSANPEYGTVTGGGSYSAGTVITLNAEANDGYRFVQWSYGNTDNPREITVMENAVYVAYFTENPPAPAYTITAVSANPEHGSVTGGGTYPEGAVISIEAIANEGYEFISWNDNIIDNPREITVTSDAMYIATFVPVTDIAENAVPEISVYPNPVEDILNITSSVEITEIEIVNVMGQIVLRKDVNSDSTVCNVAGLPSGVYMVRIYSRPFAPSANAQGANAQGTAVLRKFVKE